MLLIMGLGCTSAMWFRIVPELSRHHRVILMDNRGVGRTEAPGALVHSVSTMAADAAAVIAAAVGNDTAHVMGLSMGGMIAQQLAIDHPQAVRTLTLAATNCGGSQAVLPATHVWQLLFSKGDLDPLEALEAMRPYTYARATPQRVVDEDSGVRLASYPNPRGYQAQLYGLLGWSSYLRLQQIEAPTLVMHGKEDQLIPPINGRNLAKRIPNARLLELEHASHWIHSDQPERTAQAVIRFIRNPKAPLTEASEASP